MCVFLRFMYKLDTLVLTVMLLVVSLQKISIVLGFIATNEYILYTMCVVTCSGGKLSMFD